MDIYTRLRPSRQYKLLELTPEVLTILEAGTEELSIKASGKDSEIVLCSSDATFQIRQKNHTNTLLLMNHTQDGADERLVGFSSLSSELELTKVKGKIDLISKIPVYANFGDDLSRIESCGFLDITVDELVCRSPVSTSEFRTLWFDKYNGCEIEGKAVLLSRGFITQALNFVLTALLASELDMARLSVRDTLQAVEDTDYTHELVRTVLWKFSLFPTVNEQGEEQFSLDKAKVSKWYGVNALREHAQRLISPDEFLIAWKSAFPPFFDCPIDLQMLAGYYVRPLVDKIQYINLDTVVLVEKDPIKRFKMLFKLQSTWDMPDILPFIEDLNVRNLKIDNFIMKYAKKKRVGKKFVVTGR
ncbi:hypothetical protein BABINDRAFT_162550 [Babjeviella inositovora NRRL Y-12698]|uniref:Sister chromatid cohesion protein DCC1 n=1 Tax=Babjeviella inositovora NRRL Y-12698 TaxID=984486 RepID=A0A1E3QML4_9ASCO|nr:uncharacterized protein BABINDRAFT_162550 [Babjeviella inositovora NRRL Y-12698]ODQ78880.1 hypothetical protein BABINDRAFT_162550 [Babjeviella inositovora NRRL Y-12698]